MNIKKIFDSAEKGLQTASKKAAFKKIEIALKNKLMEKIRKGKFKIEENNLVIYEASDLKSLIEDLLKKIQEAEKSYEEFLKSLEEVKKEEKNGEDS